MGGLLGRRSWALRLPGPRRHRRRRRQRRRRRSSTRPRSRSCSSGSTQGRADWVKSTYITDDTEILAAQAADQHDRRERAVREGRGAFRRGRGARGTARKLKLLKLSLTVAAPSDPAERAELTRIGTAMEGAYGKGKYCPTKDRCLDLEDITKIMATSRDAKELLDVWAGWHAIGGPIKKDYVRFVELSNKGARELGFKDTGAMWRSKYDMPPDAFSAELDRLWAAGAAALRLAPRLRPLEAAREIRRRRPGERPDPRAPARQHVGADLGQRLSAGRAEGRRSRLRPDEDPEVAQHGPAPDGPVRRGVLHLARLRPAAEDVLGAVACSRSRGTARSSATRAPGTSTTSTTCASRCASTSRPRTSRRSTTSSATTTTSAPTTSSRSSSATAPTTASTRRSATRSRSRSRRSTS